MAFKQKSGYNPSFKMMGSSPLAQQSNMETTENDPDRYKDGKERFMSGQDSTQLYEDSDGEFYTYSSENLYQDTPKAEADSLALDAGLDKLYVPKYKDGGAKVSRNRWKEPTGSDEVANTDAGLDDDYFNTMTIGDRKVILPSDYSEEPYSKGPTREYISRGAGRNTPPKQ